MAMLPIDGPQAGPGIHSFGPPGTPPIDARSALIHILLNGNQLQNNAPQAIQDVRGQLSPAHAIHAIASHLAGHVANSRGLRQAARGIGQAVGPMNGQEWNLAQSSHPNDFAAAMAEYLAKVQNIRSAGAGPQVPMTFGNQ